MLGPHLLLAHGVWLDDDEVELVLDRTAIAYCPWAYLRLGQGVTRVGRHAEIVERGGRVALGCDASNAGDLADILRAAAAPPASPATRASTPSASAPTAFELATIAGAEAIGMADRIGSSSPASRPTSSCTAPTAGAGRRGRRRAAARLGDRRPVGARRRDRRQPVVRDGRCVTVDAEAVWRAAAALQPTCSPAPGSPFPTAGRRSTPAKRFCP